MGTNANEYIRNLAEEGEAVMTEKPKPLAEGWADVSDQAIGAMASGVAVWRQQCLDFQVEVVVLSRTDYERLLKEAGYGE